MWTMVGLAAARIDARMARYTPATIAGPGKKDAAAMIAWVHQQVNEECQAELAEIDAETNGRIEEEIKLAEIKEEAK